MKWIATALLFAMLLHKQNCIVNERDGNIERIKWKKKNKKTLHLSSDLSIKYNTHIKKKCCRILITKPNRFWVQFCSQLQSWKRRSSCRKSRFIDLTVKWNEEKCRNTEIDLLLLLCFFSIQFQKEKGTFTAQY